MTRSLWGQVQGNPNQTPNKGQSTRVSVSCIYGGRSLQACCPLTSTTSRACVAAWLCNGNDGNPSSATTRHDNARAHASKRAKALHGALRPHSFERESAQALTESWMQEFRPRIN